MRLSSVFWSVSKSKLTTWTFFTAGTKTRFNDNVGKQSAERIAGFHSRKFPPYTSASFLTYGNCGRNATSTGHTTRVWRGSLLVSAFDQNIIDQQGLLMQIYFLLVLILFYSQASTQLQILWGRDWRTTALTDTRP